jgi:AraC-like DNA-binding protein
VHAAFFNRQYDLFAFTDNIWVFTSLSSYPLYYYYIRLLTREIRIDWRWSWILLPAMVLSIFSFVIYFAMSPEELNLFVRGVMYHEQGFTGPYPQLVRLQVLRTTLFKAFFLVQVILSVWFGYRLIVRYNKEVKEFYSNTGGKDLSSVKWILFAFLFASVVSLVSNVIGKDFFVDKGPLIAFPALTHSLFLFFIGYVGYHQNFTVADFTNDVNDYRKKRLRATERKQPALSDRITKQHLSDLLRKNELYKNPELRITDIALMAGTNRTYISRIVNEEMQTNFCDWVNGFRIEYVKGIMKNPEYDNLSMLQIAEMSGFSSLSAFYRVFKAKEGIAPGEYREHK